MKQINIANQSYLKQKKNNFISYFKYYYSELIQTCSLFFPPSRFQFIRFYVTFYRISGSLHASRSSINVSSEQIITWTAGNTRFYQLNGIFSFFSLFFFFFSFLFCSTTIIGNVRTSYRECELTVVCLTMSDRECFF